MRRRAQYRVRPAVRIPAGGIGSDTAAGEARGGGGICGQDRILRGDLLLRGADD